MKIKIGLLAALALTAISLSTGAQTAEEIVQKHIAAMGGNAWQKVTSLKRSSKMDMMGQEMLFTEVMMPGKGMRRDVEMKGQKGYSIITPTAGWTYMPMIPGADKMTEMSPEELKASQSELQVGGELYNAKSNGDKIELMGKEDLDGKPVYKMKLTNAAGQENTTYVDAATYYIVRRDEEKPMMGQTVSMETTFADYQKLPEGIVVPFKASRKAMGMDLGSTTFSDFEVNKQKDVSIFKP